MGALELKISGLATLTGYTRFQMHGLLDEVFPGPTRTAKKARLHRTFSPRDLIAIAVVCELERKYGVKRSVLRSVGDPLRRALNGPRNSNREARLVVTFTPPTATYVESGGTVAEGVVLPLGPLFAKVDEYLGVAESNRDGGQGVLALSPAVLINRRGGRSRA